MMPLGFPSAYQRINKIAEVTPLIISCPSSDRYVVGAREPEGWAEGKTLFRAFAAVCPLERSPGVV
jgi:hypothetical protein